MTIKEIALQIFIKRMPTAYYTEATAKEYKAKAEESYELAILFNNSDPTKKEEREKQLSFSFISPSEL